MLVLGPSSFTGLKVLPKLPPPCNATVLVIDARVRRGGRWEPLRAVPETVANCPLVALLSLRGGAGATSPRAVLSAGCSEQAHELGAKQRRLRAVLMQRSTMLLSHERPDMSWAT